MRRRALASDSAPAALRCEPAYRAYQGVGGSRSPRALLAARGFPSAMLRRNRDCTTLYFKLKRATLAAAVRFTLTRHAAGSLFSTLTLIFRMRLPSWLPFVDVALAVASAQE